MVDDKQRVDHRPCGVKDPVHAWTLYAREPGDLSGTHRQVGPAGRSGKACGYNPDMDAAEKSDINIVPKKVPNKVSPPKRGCGGTGGKGDDQGEPLKRRL